MTPPHEEAPERDVVSRLQRELRQSRPFRSRGQEAFLALLRTADGVKHRFNVLFEGVGITLQQYNVLRILRGAGEAGIPTLEIGERMIERTPGVTRLLDRLEAKGLVRRERCPEDRRKVLCHISGSGLSLLDALDGPVENVDELIFRDVPEGDVETLIRILDQLRGQCEDQGDGRI